MRYRGTLPLQRGRALGLSSKEQLSAFHSLLHLCESCESNVYAGGFHLDWMAVYAIQGGALCSHMRVLELSRAFLSSRDAAALRTFPGSGSVLTRWERLSTKDHHKGM